MAQTKFISYLKLLRLKDIRAYFWIAFFGFFVSKGFLFPAGDIIAYFIMSVLLLAFGFAINDCFDTEEDMLQGDKGNPLVKKEISFKKGLFFSLLVGAAGLAVSLIFGVKIFLFCSAAFLLVLSYSIPPFRLKSRPILDLLSHGLFGGAIIFLTPVLIFSRDIGLFHYLIAFSLFYCSMMLETRNHLEDYETDKKAGLRTTVCVIGDERAAKLLRYMAILYPLTVFPIFCLFLKEYVILFLAFTIAFLVFFLIQKSDKMLGNYRLLDVFTVSSLILISIASI